MYYDSFFQTKLLVDFILKINSIPFLNLPDPSFVIRLRLGSWVTKIVKVNPSETFIVIVGRNWFGEYFYLYFLH